MDDEKENLHDLLSHIRKHLARVTGEQTGEDVQITASLDELDQIAAAHRANLPGELAHFLSKRSYIKARIFIDNFVRSSLC